MSARLRLLLAILFLALAPALAPAPVAAAMLAACDVCDHSCDSPCDQGVPLDCVGNCLSHAAAPVLLMGLAALAQPAAEAERAALPRHPVLAATTWPPPVRPPRS